MRLVGPSGFDGGCLPVVLPPARESCTNTVEGRRAGVDKSNAPNATIFGRSLYYRASEPPLSRPFQGAFPLYRESGPSHQRNIISSEKGAGPGERKTLALEGGFL